MQRRKFLGTVTAAVAGAASGQAARPAVAQSVSTPKAPEKIGGLSLSQLRADYHRRLFDLYLPFWDKGGVDRRHGGFLCELNDDGTAHSQQKNLWYQGRGLWVYSFLYNEFGKDRRWLEIARAARDFILKHMYAGDGRWYEMVGSDGTLLEGVAKHVYGWLFAAAGLGEYYLAEGRREDLDMVKASVRAALQAYDAADYTDNYIKPYMDLDLPQNGLRSQGHSMVVLSALARLLARHSDAELEAVQRQHVGRIMQDFWNPDYRIQNEFLDHDYRRLRGAEDHMYSGHAVESLWMVMAIALQRGDRGLFDTAAQRVRHLLEMTWDYVFDGFGSGNYHVFGDAKHRQGPDFNIKTMWAQCEAMIACMMVLEQTGETWAREWYERLRAFTLRTMPVAAHGVWRQAVDRRGKDIPRASISRYRKDNFHQARYLMLNLLALERMIGGKS